MADILNVLVYALEIKYGYSFESQAKEKLTLKGQGGPSLEEVEAGRCEKVIICSLLWL